MDNAFEIESSDDNSGQSAPRLLNPYKERRFMELKQWSFIPEKRVELGAGEFNIFLMGVVRRNWRKLAEPMKKYDSELVYEFYANVWGERQSEGMNTRPGLEANGFTIIHGPLMSF